MMDNKDSLAPVQKPQTQNAGMNKAAAAVKGMLARLSVNDEQPQQKTGLQRWLGLLVLVVLPLLLVSGYYLLWVSDRYVSTTQLIVKKNNTDSGVSSTLGFLVPGASLDSQDAYLVVNYIHSLDMANYLDKTLQLSDYYKSHDYDFFSRLAGDATQEDYLGYYRDHVAVGYDETTGIITIEAQAFEPAFAQRLVRELTEKSEDFVNAISNQLAEKQVAFVRQELDLAQSKLRNSKQEILDFQNKNEVVSPEELTKGISGIIQELEAKRAESRAKLTAAKTYLNPNSSQVVSLQAEIDALQQQIEAEKLRLVGASDIKGEERLNSLSADFQNLQLNLQFAMDAYQAALTALETARMEASGRLKHLMVVSLPSLAEEAEYPRKLYNLASLAVILLLLYGIVKMLVASIRDHRI